MKNGQNFSLNGCKSLSECKSLSPTRRRRPPSRIPISEPTIIRTFITNPYSSHAVRLDPLQIVRNDKNSNVCSNNQLKLKVKTFENRLFAKIRSMTALRRTTGRDSLLKT